MPPTANELVHAARVVFATAKDERAMELLTRWLDGCRDWRREPTAQQDQVVVSMVFAEAIKAQSLRMQVAQNVKRWGFMRRAHAKNYLIFLTIDEYLKGGVGELVLRHARELIQKGVQRHAERADFIAHTRSERLQEKLAKFREAQ